MLFQEWFELKYPGGSEEQRGIALEAWCAALEPNEHAMKKKNKQWNRKLWGIEFSSNGEKTTLIGGNWHDKLIPRYDGEPTRPVLFKTQKLARQWCREQRKKYNYIDDITKHWRFKPVRVKELVEVQR